MIEVKLNEILSILKFIRIFCITFLLVYVTRIILNILKIYFGKKKF